jgi:hypothetical protein
MYVYMQYFPVNKFRTPRFTIDDQLLNYMDISEMLWRKFHIN